MYLFYKIFSRVSKFLSNGFLIIGVPISIILVTLFAMFFWLEPLLTSIGVWQTVKEALDKVALDAPSVWNIFHAAQWVALALMLFIILCWAIFIGSWVLKKTLFKRVAGNDIARNKEYRNKDINQYQEKLEKYRYRD